MKRYIILIICLFFSCSNSYNKTEYENPDLLFRYLNDYQKNKINFDDFYFLVMRTHNLCSGCYKITLDSAFNIALSKTDSKPVYVLLDEKSFYMEKIIEPRRKIFFLLDESTDLDKYGLNNTYPLLFHIKDNILIDFTKIIR